jgi:hypothetical protein
MKPLCVNVAAGLLRPLGFVLSQFTRLVHLTLLSARANYFAVPVLRFQTAFLFRLATAATIFEVRV